MIDLTLSRSVKVSEVDLTESLFVKDETVDYNSVHKVQPLIPSPLDVLIDV